MARGGRYQPGFRQCGFTGKRGAVAEIEFRLLGPLEVWRQGQRLAVGGAKPRALLVMLLLHANQAVGTDRLVDALWGEHPPAGAANALQAHVASLRRVLDRGRAGAGGHGVVVTRPPGYLLRVADDGLDVTRFERLSAQGRDGLPDDPAAAAALLADALGMWRGPALADFVFEPFAQAEAARLEELRLAALEWRIEADLALGRQAELVPELQSLVAGYPLRERLAGQLMLALYSSGRQADACGVYDATRAVLAEELGMDPGPWLRQLHEQILGQDPALTPGENAGLRRPGMSRGPQGPAHNLPAELTSFVGRERELDEVASRLRQARLLTLTGTGGSGKTRLALRVARKVAGDYPGGVWLVELAALADPSLVAQSVAAALGVREESRPLIETLQRRLRSARMLVVMDNCEHLVQACAEVAHGLLSACQGVQILATSREPLNTAGELIWPVPGLGMPDTRTPPPLDQAGTYPAIRLFAERAAASQPGFTLSPANTEAITHLCQRLDGMPLAIELAAARVRVVSPQDILRRLDDRFALLTGGNRDALARQKSLRATVDWSYDLLGGSERVLFRRLAVFAGRWSVTDAEQVCGDTRLPAATVFEELCQLVTKSLVAAEPPVAGPARYLLLETLRDYAAQRLAAAGEQEAIRRRHFGHFLELAERAHEQKATSGSDPGLTLLAAHQDNLRAALVFAAGTDPQGLVRLAAAMEQLWLAGNIAEGRRWLDEALTLAPQTSPERVRALLTAGWLASVQQDHARARELVTDALGLASRFGDQASQARARLTLGLIEFSAEDPAKATRHLTRSLAMHQALGDRLGICRSRAYLGAAMTLTPVSSEQGRKELEPAAEMAHELNDGWCEGFALMFLGFAETEAGARASAATHLRRALLIEAMGPLRAGAFEGLAQLAIAQDPKRALRLLGAAHSLRDRQAGRPPPFIRRRAAAIRAQAGQRLDPDIASQAWDEGCQMTTEEAIPYALKNHQPHQARQSQQDIQANAT
jgi:predicted ATPase/DNA-binding SARP family transcriptional activator